MQQAHSAHAEGDSRAAEELCRRILEESPDHLEALNLLGIIKAQSGFAEEAAELLRRVVQALPANAVAHNNYGNILRDLGRLEAALASYDRALELNPDYAEACNNRGGALFQLGRLDEALASYDRALRLRKGYGEAHFARGVVLQHSKRLEDAARSYTCAIAINPGFADAHYNLGRTLHDLRMYRQALLCYENAIGLKPGFAQAYNNRGNAAQELGLYDEALRNYEQALAVDPDLIEAYINRGEILQEQNRLDEALESYSRAMRQKPDYEWLMGSYLHTKMLLCDWHDLASQARELSLKIAQGRKVARPSTVFALSDDLRLLLQAAQISARDSDAAQNSLPPLMRRPPRDKIRLGYFSADYYNHATAHLSAGLFECHDRTGFELVAFSFGPDKRDPMRERLSAAFDRFIDVRTKSDRDVALLSRDLQIDIAVDMKGFTKDSRPGIFAHRAAAIQVNFLGYPGSMGARYIDYIIADRTLIPEASRPCYSEKVVYLPDSYQVNDARRPPPAPAPARALLNLPGDAFVFCCFNSSYKITAGVFDSWMRILAKTGRSVLWLLVNGASTAANLRNAAEARGVDASRLIFAPFTQPAQHLSRLGAADLFLDTFPCNAHTTASDALWAGVPVVTRLGESFASRVAGSLLHGIGLSELITTSVEQYEEVATALADNPGLLSKVKMKLLGNRPTASLFNTGLFTGRLEDAYRQMYRRHHSGLEPEDIHVAGRNERGGPQPPG